jgi:DNA-binding transcriptional LysR family regulator
MNFSLRQLRAFVAAANCGSFTKAAERLHVTQAGLSAMIRELEVQVGCQLFERTTRMVTLSEAGKRLLPVVTRTVHDLETSMTEVGHATASSRTRLRIGVAPLVASSLLPSVLRRFHTDHAGVEVEIVDAERDDIQNLVESGEVDAGFGVFFNKVSGVRRQALFPCGLTLVMPNNLKQGPRNLRTPWTKVPAEPLVALPEQNLIQKLVDEKLATAGVFPKKRITVRSLATVIALVEGGFGVAVIPSFATWACRRYEVRTSALIDPVVEFNFYCITRSGRRVPAALDTLSRVFMESALANA